MERCEECGEALPYHQFRCPESVWPRSLWNKQSAAVLFKTAFETVIPFPYSAYAKLYKKDLVTSRLACHPSARELERIDPRLLLATQPGLQRPAIEYYLGDKYRTLGRPFAEPHNPGNKYPVIYRYRRPHDGETQMMILAGHHRSTAALLQGRPVFARVIEGRVWRIGEWS